MRKNLNFKKKLKIFSRIFYEYFPKKSGKSNQKACKCGSCYFVYPLKSFPIPKRVGANLVEKNDI